MTTVQCLGSRARLTESCSKFQNYYHGLVLSVSHETWPVVVRPKTDACSPQREGRVGFIGMLDCRGSFDFGAESEYEAPERGTTLR